MKSRVFIIVILLLLGLLSVARVYAANTSVQLVVNTSLSDGTPIAGVLVNVTLNNNVVASEVSDENGQVVFNLPGNQTYRVIAEYGVWSENKTVYLDGKSEVIRFIVKYGLPIAEYDLPLRLTIWTPGGFIMTFEEADNVTATVSTYQPGIKYNLVVRKNYVNFECNNSGYFIVNIHVTYRMLDWYSGSLTTYSKSALVRTVQGFSFYSKNLVVHGLVEAIVGPHYPTPEEIAKAQSKYLKEVENNILKYIMKMNTETYLQFKQFHKMLNETNTNIKGFGEFYRKNINGLTDNLSELFANTWAGILIVSIATVFIGIIMFAAYRSKGEREVLYPEDLLKEFKKLEKQIQEYSKSKSMVGKKGGGLKYAIIILLAIAAVFVIIIIYYPGLLRWLPWI